MSVEQFILELNKVMAERSQCQKELDILHKKAKDESWQSHQSRTSEFKGIYLGDSSELGKKHSEELDQIYRKFDKKKSELDRNLREEMEILQEQHARENLGKVEEVQFFENHIDKQLQTEMKVADERYSSEVEMIEKSFHEKVMTIQSDFQKKVEKETALSKKLFEVFKMAADLEQFGFAVMPNPQG